MKRVLVTGADGQLGKCLQHLVKKREDASYDFIFANRQQFDITNKELVESYFFSNSLAGVINCAAYTNVDKAEEEVEKAFAINADGVKNLAVECNQQNAFLIHISTDYVFDGKLEQEYLDDDIPNPLNVYGKSKLEGERLALEYCKSTVIIRTSWLYSPFGKNFVKTILKLLQENKEIKVVDDQFGKPTNSFDLAKAILQIIAMNFKPGIYHYSNKGKTSWFGFAQKIQEIISSSSTMYPVSSSDYKSQALRPQYSMLDTQKFEETFGIKIPNWEDSLHETLISQKELYHI